MKFAPPSIFLLLGAAVLGGTWLGPLPALAVSSFSAHMAMHMIVVAVASPLLAFGFAGSRFDPVRRWPALFPPLPISVVELLVVWAWHAPAWHHLARHSAGGLIAEQSTFLLCGLLIWLAAFGGERPRGRERAGAGVAALLLTSMHMTFLGALLALTPRPLYTHAGHLAALTPLEDQHLGGAIMLIVGGVSYLSGGLWLVRDLLRAAPRKLEVAA